MDMQISNDGVSWSSWEPAATAKAWILAAGDGNKTVLVRLRDLAGNIRQISSSTITLAPSVNVTMTIGTSTNQHGNLDAALTLISAGDTAEIRAQATTFFEDLNLNTPNATVTLSGGWNAAFTNTSGYSIVQGNLTVTGGTVVTDAIALQ